MKLRSAALAIALCLAAATPALSLRLDSSPPTPGSTGGDWVAEILFVYDRAADASAHLSKLRAVAGELCRSVDETFPLGARIGLVTFIDKAHPPFGYFGDYAYRLDVALTSNHTALVTKIESLDSYDGGGDPAGSQLEALFFGAALKDVGWSEGDTDLKGNPILRLVVLVTNNVYHTYQEGLDEGLYDPVYSRFTHSMSYPQLSYIADAFKRRKIHPLFLLGRRGLEEKYQHVSDQVSAALKRSDGTEYRVGRVEALAPDSTNLLQVFDSSINALLSDIERPTRGVRQLLPYEKETDLTAEFLVLYDMSSFSEESWQPTKNSARSMAHGLFLFFPGSKIAVGSFTGKPHAASADDYCYKTEVGMTDDVEALVGKVHSLEPKGHPRHSQLDALYFGLMSPSVGWHPTTDYNGRPITRVVIMVTQNSYHTHLPGVSVPLPPGLTNASQCGEYDYASMDQVKEVFDSMQATPIFLVPETSYYDYGVLMHHIDRLGAVQTTDKEHDFLESLRAGLAYGISSSES